MEVQLHLAFPPIMSLYVELPEKPPQFFNTFNSTGTYPLDVVRRRMQMKGATGELFKYNSTWHAFNVIAKTEGIHGLFKGMWPNLLKVTITYISLLWRYGDFMVSMLTTELSSPGSSPG